MKILIDARFYGLENAGLGRYTINLLDQLQKIDRKNEYKVLLRKKYFDSVNFNSNFEKVLAEISHYSFKEQTEIPQVIRKYNPDLTHFLHFNVPLTFRGKFIVTIHDMTMHRQKTSATNLLLPIYYTKHLVYKKVFSNAVKKSEKIIVPSEFVKDELVKNFKIDKEKVSVIYEGISAFNSNFENSFPRSRQTSWPVTSFSGNPSKLDPYFLYVGNAYPHKNLEFAIKAIVELNKHTNRKICFYIVTKEDKFGEKLKRLVNRLKAKEIVKVLGFLDDEKLQKLYENSVGFIYPSLSEGFGLQGLEALKTGTLLLSSNISVFKEIYGSSAIYFNPRDTKSLINSVNKALSISKIDAEKVIRENKKFVMRYSWEKMAKQTLEVYETLTS